MKCTKCKSPRIMSFTAKVSDCFTAEINGKEYDGYVPEDINLGGGDYMEGSLCLKCGLMQGEWPLPTTEMETALAESPSDEDEDNEFDDEDEDDVVDDEDLD